MCQGVRALAGKCLRMSKVSSKGDMTCREAGKKGGSTTSARYGPDFYVAIGKKGGDKVRALIAAGRESGKVE